LTLLRKLGAAHEVATATSRAAPAIVVAPQVAGRRSGLARLYRGMDRGGADPDKVRLVGSGLSQRRSAPDAIAQRVGCGHRSDASARFHAAHAAEPAQFGATGPPDRPRYRDKHSGRKGSAVQAAGRRYFGRAGYFELVDPFLPRPGSSNSQERSAGSIDDLRGKNRGHQPS